MTVSVGNLDQARRMKGLHFGGSISMQIKVRWFSWMSKCHVFLVESLIQKMTDFHFDGSIIYANQLEMVFLDAVVSCILDGTCKIETVQLLQIISPCSSW